MSAVKEHYLNNMEPTVDVGQFMRKYRMDGLLDRLANLVEMIEETKELADKAQKEIEQIRREI